MKRLIKKASTTTLYHCTSAQRLIQIINGGSIGTDKYTDNGGNGEVVFLGVLTDKVSMLTQYGSNVIGTGDQSMPDWVVILEVEVSEDKLLPDMDDWKLNNFSEEEEVTWQDSLEKLQQVAHDGPISSSQITSVINCYEDNMDIDPGDCVLYNGSYDYKGLKEDLERRFSGSPVSLGEFQQKWNEISEDVKNYIPNE